MKLFIRVNVIGISVFGFTVAVALLYLIISFLTLFGHPVSENYALNQIKADLGGLWILVGISPASLAKNKR